MGGRVGLKGTDGPGVVERARMLGAVPEAPRRAVDALWRVRSSLMEELDVLAAAHLMGADEATEAGFAPRAVGAAPMNGTIANHTLEAARLMADDGVNLLLFAGGDGTARNIHDGIGDRVPVVGVPAGVKVHSGVFSISPRAAGHLARSYLTGNAGPVRDAEVMDIDEEAFRAGSLSARLYGYLKVPYDDTLLQGSKDSRAAGDEAALDDIAIEMAERMRDGRLYVLGPGTTTRAIARQIGVEKTLLGVDIIQAGELVAVDVSETDLLKAIEGQSAAIVVTPIGGQGHVFGRGNQQISPTVIRRVGRDNVIVVATPEKLASLRDSLLLVDTGDAEVDAMLSGYHRVVTGFGREAVCRTSS